MEIRSQLVSFQGRPSAWVEVRDLTVERRRRLRSDRLIQLLRFAGDINQTLTEADDVGVWLDQAVAGLRQAGDFPWAVVVRTRSSGQPDGRVHSAGLEGMKLHLQRLQTGPWPNCFQRAQESRGLYANRAVEVCDSCLLREVCPGFDTWHVRLEWRQQVLGV